MPHRRHKSACPCPGSGIRRGAVLKHTSALYLRHAYLTDRNDGAARHRTMTTSRLTNTRRDRGGQIGRGRQRGTTATVGVACDAAAVSGGGTGGRERGWRDKPPEGKQTTGVVAARTHHHHPAILRSAQAEWPCSDTDAREAEGRGLLGGSDPREQREEHQADGAARAGGGAE